MKYVGLDLGSRTCGVAISDELGILARAVTTIRFNDNEYTYCAKEVLKICQTEGAKAIVLGLPKHMNGDMGERAQISLKFKEKIQKLNSDIEVILYDERLTTITVDRIMISGNVKRNDRHKKKDEMAAVVILQDYLNSKGF